MTAIVGKLNSFQLVGPGGSSKALKAFETREVWGGLESLGGTGLKSGWFRQPRFLQCFRRFWFRLGSDLVPTLFRLFAGWWDLGGPGGSGGLGDSGGSRAWEALEAFGAREV